MQCRVSAKSAGWCLAFAAWLSSPGAAGAACDNTDPTPQFESSYAVGWGIDHRNTRSLRLAKHVGFRHTHTIADGVARGVDMRLLELRRHECKYLPAPVAKAVGYQRGCHELSVSRSAGPAAAAELRADCE